MAQFIAVKSRVKGNKRKGTEIENGAEREIIADGPFWYMKPYIHIDPKTSRRSYSGINQKEIQRLHELVKSQFFTPQILAVIANMNEESSNKCKKTRLRSFDWAVTNFTKGNQISYLKISDDEKGAIIDPHLSYSSELNRGHRLLFDPFRRGSHIYFDADGKNSHSTVGQLCFLKWCFENGVDKYVDENSEEIKKNMSHVSKKRRRHRKTESENDIEKIENPVFKRSRMELTPTPKSIIRGLVPMTQLHISA